MDLDKRFEELKKDRRRLSQIKARIFKIDGEKAALLAEKAEIEKRWADEVE